jgi:hypothetical protein
MKVQMDWIVADSKETLLDVEDTSFKTEEGWSHRIPELVGMRGR